MCATYTALKTSQDQTNNCIASCSNVKWKNILSQRGIIGLTESLDACTSCKSEAVAICQEQSQLHL